MSGIFVQPWIYIGEGFNNYADKNVNDMRIFWFDPARGSKFEYLAGK